MNHVVETLFTSEKYTTQQMILYYLGAFSWFSAYILVVRRIIREKFIEFPGFIIAGNVPWELLWGSIFRSTLAAFTCFGSGVVGPYWIASIFTRCCAGGARRR